MNPAAAAVLVMARAPSSVGCHPALEPLLGADRCARLQRALIRRASAWAATTAPGAAFLACEPAGELKLAAAAAVPGLELFPQEGGSPGERLTNAAARVFERTAGPLLVVGTGLPGLGPYHAQAALEDLAEGCDVVLGVAIGGGLYLIGVRTPQPRLFELFGGELDGALTRRYAREAAADLRLEVGMLHYERTLTSTADVDAMLADPLLPAEIADVLHG